jgi:hypothetical protein
MNAARCLLILKGSWNIRTRPQTTGDGNYFEPNDSGTRITPG